MPLFEMLMGFARRGSLFFVCSSSLFFALGGCGVKDARSDGASVSSQQPYSSRGLTEDSLIGAWNACTIIDENQDGIFDKDKDFSIFYRIDFSSISIKNTMTHYSDSLDCTGFAYAAGETSAAYILAGDSSVVPGAKNLNLAAINIETVTLHDDVTVAFYNMFATGNPDHLGAHGKANWIKDVPMIVTGTQFDGTTYTPAPTYSILKVVNGKMYLGRSGGNNANDGSTDGKRHAVLDMDQPYTIER